MMCLSDCIRGVIRKQGVFKHCSIASAWIGQLKTLSNVCDIGVAMVFYDKEGCQNPMDKNYKEAYVIFDSDPVDLTKKKFIQIESNVSREDEDDE